VLRFLNHKQSDIHKHRTAPLNDRSARCRARYLYKTEHTQQTNMSAHSRIRTCDPSNRAAVDLLLRRQGHRDGPQIALCYIPPNYFVCPLVSMWLSTAELPRKSILGTFMKICRENANLVTTGQKYWALYMRFIIVIFCFRRHKFPTKSMSVNAKYSYIADSDTWLNNTHRKDCCLSTATKVTLTCQTAASYIKCLLYKQREDRLCGLGVRVSGYRYRGPGFDSRRYQIF